MFVQFNSTKSPLALVTHRINQPTTYNWYGQPLATFTIYHPQNYPTAWSQQDPSQKVARRGDSVLAQGQWPLTTMTSSSRPNARDSCFNLEKNTIFPPFKFRPFFRHFASEIFRTVALNTKNEIVFPLSDCQRLYPQNYCLVYGWGAAAKVPNESEKLREFFFHTRHMAFEDDQPSS